VFCFSNQQVASNDCITDTTRYSVRRAGLLFCIGFESNGKRTMNGISYLYISAAGVGDLCFSLVNKTEVQVTTVGQL